MTIVDKFFNHYSPETSSILTLSGALFVLPIEELQSEIIKHVIMKIPARYAVNFFKTEAVDVPNKESPASPPKEAPSPKLLLS
jgi:hypothetical protein|tara:strand:- start:1 stop:249 length:249 start_codon:yes stop_codon:yes gene_type:complete